MKHYLLICALLLATAVSANSELPATSSQPAATKSTASMVTGQILNPDKTPMTDGVVLLFDKKSGAPPHPYNYWRVPDVISGLDEDGKFSISVPEGTYYLIAAQKNPDDPVGPPKPSAFFYYFHGDAGGTPRPVNVMNGSNVSLGVNTAALWSPDKVQRGKKITAAEGIVTDSDGKPVENAIVFAYLSKEAMGRPLFVSDRTDSEGRYQMRVHDGGEYYLKVRSVVGGGTPKEGEYLNTTKEFEPVKVTLKKGVITKGVSLKVKRFTRSKGAEGDKSRGQLELEKRRN